FDKIEYYLAELEEEEWNTINGLNVELFKMENKLNEKLLCEGCKGKEIEKLTDKCENEEIARFLYKCKLNANNNKYIRWIPFGEFKNIEYLAKGGFGEVHKATWINGYYNILKMKYYDREVVLKKIHNNSSDDNIVDIL